MTTIDPYADDLTNFALSCPATEITNLAKYPEWFLAAFDTEQPSPQAVLAAYILHRRRTEPDISPATALHDLQCQVQCEPPEPMIELLQAFSLCCVTERMRRHGYFATFTTSDPFSMDAQNSCTFSEQDIALLNSAKSPEQRRQFMDARFEQCFPSNRHRFN